MVAKCGRPFQPLIKRIGLNVFDADQALLCIDSHVERHAPELYVSDAPRVFDLDQSQSRRRCIIAVQRPHASDCAARGARGPRLDNDQHLNDVATRSDTRSDGVNQPLRRDRFTEDAGDVQFLMWTGLPRHDDHRNLSGMRLRGKLLAHHMAVKPGQPQIENYRVEYLSIEKLQRLQAIARLVHVESDER